MKPVIRYSLFVVLIIWLLVAAAEACTPDNKTGPNDFRRLVPAHIKDSMYLSNGNDYTTEKAALGRYFFYDRRLSVNQTKSCASCHDPAFSFTDSYRRSIGALGDNVRRNAPALVNIVFNKYLTAADSSLHFPEQQINNPLFHQQPVELGWSGHEIAIMARIKKDSLYRRQLPVLFQGQQEFFTVKNIQDCISSFVKTLLSFDAPYDRYIYKNDSLALSAPQIRGMRLFFSERLHCSNCHGGVNFSAPQHNGDYYVNTGLYNIDSIGGYPAEDRGLYEITGQKADMGKFRVPTLRNLAFTAPYLHDGSAASLESVITIYEVGGRHIPKGSNCGNGTKNPFKHPLLRGFVITGQERKDLIHFLHSLSDTAFCKNPLYGNPFTRDETRQ